MAYIGREPTVGNFQVCDAISVVNGQAAYTMQVDSTNVSPETANHMIVSLNGVLQKPGSSFTVSGSTITFASNLVTGDVIDFIHILGSVLDLGTPSDATVTQAKTNFVSTSSSAGLQIKGDGTTDGTLQLNCSQNSHGIKLKSPAHSAGQSYTLTFPTTAPSADKALITDGSGNLSFGSAGASNSFFAYDVSSGSAGDLVFTTELYDDGGNYNTSNGRYTAPSAGKYLFIGSVYQSQNNTDNEIYFKKNGTAVGGGTNGFGFSYDTTQSCQISMLIDLAQNDYIQMTVSSSVYTVYCNFGGVKLY